MIDFKQMASPRYSGVERGFFDDIFFQLSNILCFFHKEGVWETVLKIYPIPEGISKTLISIGINLISNCVDDSYFNFILDLEFYKIITSNKNISQNDLSEIIIIKNVLPHLRTLNAVQFYELANSICSNDVRCKILQQLKEEFKDEFNF